MGSPERLYFVTRADLPEGRRCAQLIHAMDLWCAAHGPQHGTVIVYSVKNEAALLGTLDKLPTTARQVLFREPDFDFAATALATDAGPLRLPLLGGRPPTPS